MSPKGKLWDRYHGRKRFLKKLSSNQVKFAKFEETNVESEINEDVKELCLELKYIRDPLQIQEKWVKTREYRMQQIQSLTLDNIFKNWPLYACQINSLKLVSLIDLNFANCCKVFFNYFRIDYVLISHLFFVLRRLMWILNIYFDQRNYNLISGKFFQILCKTHPMIASKKTVAENCCQL